MSVREAGIGDVAQVSAALADAFANEPMMRWMIPNERRRDTRLRRLFALEIEHFVLPAGRVLTTDDFRGASFELPPGKWKMAMPLSAALGLVPALGLRLNRGIRFQTFASRHHLEEPHYYVRYIGVATRFQGQGVGAALLRATLDRCDREGMPAYIEASTERSAALYERLGFVHLGRLQVPDGPSFWPMRRPPEQKQVEAGPEAIVKNFDKPVARIVPDSAAKPKRTPGRLKGQIVIKPGFDDIPEGFEIFYE